LAKTKQWLWELGDVTIHIESSKRDVTILIHHANKTHKIVRGK
jgi:hypothetical protein